LSEVRNAAEFRIRYREYRERYKQLYGRQRRRLSSAAAPPETQHWIDEQIHDILEAHVREYLMNAFLLALNWRICIAPEDGLPNLSVEVPVRSVSTNRTRFIDYLGSEGGASAPLLILEAKRPAYQLPYVVNPAQPSATYRDVIARGLTGETLSGEWNEWLESLRDYTNSAERQWGRCPMRVVITNGEWLVAFLDPRNAFSQGEVTDALKILVIQRRDEFEARATDIFMQLEYHRVLGESPPLHLGDLELPVQAATAVGAVHGIRLLYVEDPRLDLPAQPAIRVSPIVFIELASGGCIRVDSDGMDFTMPNRKADLEAHLREVDEVAIAFLENVRRRLAADLPLHDLGPDGTVRGLPMEPTAVAKQARGDGQGEYVIATGRRTHLCHMSPSVADCPYHNWQESSRGGVAVTAEPRLRSSVAARAFFVSGDVNHCSHMYVGRSKSSAITSQVAPSCGWRSSFLGEPFCAIWEFETELCCRTCSFEAACIASPAFALPCSPA
jgi:hypothetical protein